MGSASTRLVILRGDSGSGKSTAGAALRERLGGSVALIAQDHIRREMLRRDDSRQRHEDAAVLVVALARQALDLGYDVVLDGIFAPHDYGERFRALARDHRGTTLVYQFDVGIEETVRRHSGRPLAASVTEDQVRGWYQGWQPLPGIDEHRVGPEVAVDDLVATILSDLATGRERTLDG